MASTKDTESNAAQEEAHRVLTEYMEVQHLRKTPERYAVLRAVYSFDGLFDAEQLYLRLEEKFRVSRASIYTALELLSKAGLVVRNQMPSKVYYERNIPGQIHLYKVCLECDKIERFTNDSMGRLLREMPVRRFHPSLYSLTVTGLCSRCLSNINRRKKKLDKKKAPKGKGKGDTKTFADTKDTGGGMKEKDKKKNKT